MWSGPQVALAQIPARDFDIDSSVNCQRPIFRLAMAAFIRG
jgi:hypothetical protein